MMNILYLLDNALRQNQMLLLEEFLMYLPLHDCPKVLRQYL